MAEHRSQNPIVFITIALSVVTCILAFGYFVLYEFVVLAFGITDPGAIITIRLVCVFLALSFIAATILTRYFNNIFSKALYIASATWLGFFLYFFLISVFYIAYASIFPLFQPLAIVLIAGVFDLGFLGVLNANTLRVTKIKVEIAGLPDKWKGRKVVFASDIHLGQVHGRKFSQKIVNSIKVLNPDIFFIGGDAYDGVLVNTDDVIKPFADLKLPLGTYFVPGNHEEFSDNSEYFRALRKAGMHVLIDETADVEGVKIVGVDYKTTEDPKSYENVLNRLLPGQNKMPTILLKHVPSNIDIAQKNNISLQLSGHTHLGQVFPFSFITRAVYKGFDYGLKSAGKTQVYTSSGVGTWGPPLRIGTRSEIVLIEFK